MWNVKCTLLLLAMCASIQARTVAQPDPLPPSTAATLLLSATGGSYQDERDVVLALPEEEFTPIVAHLLRADASPKEKVIGWALHIRRNRPAAAAAFDAASDAALAAPNLETRSGDALYQGVMPASPDDDPLVFEWLLKRSDVPERARWRFDLNVTQRSRTSPLTPIGALSLLDEPGAPRVGLIGAAIRQSAEILDPFVLETALAEYRRFRDMSAAPSTAASTLASLMGERTDPVMAAAIETLMDEERALATTNSIEPWNDPDAAEAHRNALADRTQALRQVQRGELSLTPQELASLEAQVEQTHLQRRFREHWEALERALAAAEGAAGQN